MNIRIFGLGMRLEDMIGYILVLIGYVCNGSSRYLLPFMFYTTHASYTSKSRALCVTIMLSYGVTYVCIYVPMVQGAYNVITFQEVGIKEFRNMRPSAQK